MRALHNGGTLGGRQIAMILAVILLLLTIPALGLRIYFMRQTENTYRGPHLHARLHAMFDAYDGVQLAPAELRSLELRADTAFRDIITGVGLVPTGWGLRVHLDELLGPFPRIHGPNGQVLDVAEFERRLRDGELDLPMG
jgi:hypothetical protein